MNINIFAGESGILKRINHQLTRLDMKLSQVKADLAQTAKDQREAFTELSTLIAELNTKLDQAVQDASDPDVTDEAFLADMKDLSAQSKQLAAIVPNAEPNQGLPPNSDPTRSQVTGSTDPAEMNRIASDSSLDQTREEAAAARANAANQPDTGTGTIRSSTGTPVSGVPNSQRGTTKPTP